MKVYAPTSATAYNIDFDWTLRARGEPVKIGKHDYGGFAVRLEYSPKRTHLNSNGQRDQATSDQRAAWCNVAAPFGDKTYGVVVYDHPANLGFPSIWRVDSLGLINPSPSLAGDWTIDRGGARTFHYRLTVHEGPGEADRFAAAAKAFAAVPFNQAAANTTDKESVALWNPEWKLSAPDFENSPLKLPEFAGRRNVLLTHPFDQTKPSALERAVDVPAGKKTMLTLNVAAHEQGDWELRILANGQLLKKQVIDHGTDRWKAVAVDLSAFAGQKVSLRLENAANNWEWEFGYWQDIRVNSL